MPLVQLAIVAGGIMAGLGAIMAMAWIIQQRSGNSRWVDATWTFGTGAVAFIASLAPIGSGPWPHGRQAVVALLIAGWALRLGLHVASRNRVIDDDPRYRQLTVQWGDAAAWRMFGFLQSQALVGTILGLSVALAAHNSNPAIRIQDGIGVVILIGALIGEAIADGQLRRFAADPGNRNAVCDVGLWRYSRHPNYFFEWLSWFSFPVIAIDVSGFNSYGWLALMAPACMYWVLVHVSGIPPLEEHMLRSRGNAFRAYQKRTRPFFPLPNGT